MHVDLRPEQRRADRQQASLARREQHDEQLGFADRKSSTAKNLRCGFRLVYQHTQDRTVDRVHDRQTQDADVGLLEEFGEADELARALFQEHRELLRGGIAGRFGGLEGFCRHMASVARLARMPIPEVGFCQVDRDSR